MTLKIVVRPKAIADLQDIWLFSESEWSRSQADAYVARIRDAFTHLAALPHSGAAFEHVRAGYRRLNVGSHVIFYKASTSRIDIVRILHQRQHAGRHLR